MKVTLLAATAFFPPAEVPWEYDGASASDLLAEFAGRACYQSWDKPNPETATNQGYLANIIKQQHFSVLEHGSVTFYIEGVSRSLTHELVRHRHFSYSQLSQRYVDSSTQTFVVPPAVREVTLEQCREDIESQNLTPEEVEERIQKGWNECFASVIEQYNILVEDLTEALPEAKRKQVREAARSVLPNATETKLVVTGNHRAWREFLIKRDNPAADAEIQQLAREIKKVLLEISPNIYQDLVTEGKQ